MASEIRVNTINNRSGLGTVSITDTGLVVSGIITATTLDTSSTSTFSSDVSIADKIIHTGDTNTAIRFPANDTFAVETGGSERLRITSAGKVGINTQSPRAVLDIEGNAENAILMLHSSDLNANLQFSDNTGGARILNYGGDLAFRTGTNADVFGTGDTEKLRITSTGNVGIGTDNPGAILHVRGSTSPRIENTGTISLIRFQNSSAENVFYGSDADNAVIYTQSTEKLRVTSSGRFGIGTSNPNATVDIQTSSAELRLTSIGQNRSVFLNSATGLQIQQIGSQNITFETNGVERVRINSLGNIGIGTDNPDRLLHLGSTGAPVIKISDYDTGVPAPSYAEMSFNGGNMVFSADAGDVSGSTRVAFEIDGDEKVRISSTGNVGIGTDNPSQKLDVNGAARFRGAIYDNNNVVGAANSVLSSTGSGVQWVSVSAGSDADTLDGLDSSQFLRSDANDSASGVIDFLGGSTTTPAIRIKSGGNNWSEGLAVHPSADNGYALTFFRTSATLTSNTNTWGIGNLGQNGTNNFGLLRNGLTGGSGIRADSIFDVTQAGVFRFGFTPTVGSNTVWHAGNDGSGSGLDADLLDGINSGSFLRSDVEDQAAVINIAGEISPTSTAKFQVYGFSRMGPIMLASGTAGATSFNVTNERWIMNDGSHLYASTNGNSYNNKIWTDSNDGSGSGLDADLLDGINSGSFLRSDAADTFSGNLSGASGANISLDSNLSLIHISEPTRPY